MNEPSSPPTPSTTPINCWIHHLPDELLSEVLTATASLRRRILESQTDGFDTPLKRDFVVVAQLVCTRWRVAVLRTPALWTFIDSRIMNATNFALLLQRSGSLNLSVNLYIGYGTIDERQFQRNMNLMSQEPASRVSQMYLKGAYTSVFLERFPSLISSLVNIRELALIDGFLDDWTTIPICASIESLAIVERSATSVPSDSFFKTLQGCPKLRVLQLENLDFGDWDHNDVLGKPKHFVLHDLRKLTLRTFYMWEMGAIFSVMGTPRLNELVIAGICTRAGEEPRLELDCPELETLVLEGLDLSLEIAQDLSHVKHLAFIGTRVAAPRQIDQTFQSLFLHWQSVSEPIPLETLKTDGFIIPALLSLLEGNRHTVVPKLRKITVHHAGIFRSSNQEEFERRASDWAKLSSLVETEVYGIPAETIEVRMKVTSWEEEREWLQRLST